MFGPSLSWQKDRFLVKNGETKAFAYEHVGRVAGHHRLPLPEDIADVAWEKTVSVF
jgi:hypothetical protein